MTHARILGFITAIIAFLGVFAFNAAMTQIEKKKQLKQFLMLQGLTMHYQDSKIIDNCKL